jgi:hypothetical protein
MAGWLLDRSSRSVPSVDVPAKGMTPSRHTGAKSGMPPEHICTRKEGRFHV